MFGLGTTELLIILAVMLVLFGHNLPALMRSMGRSVNEFKTGLNEPADKPEDSEKSPGDGSDKRTVSEK